MATAPSKGRVTFQCDPDQPHQLSPQAWSMGDGRRQHIVFHHRDGCTPLPLEILGPPGSEGRDDRRFLLMSFVRDVALRLGLTLAWRKQKLVSGDTAIQTERRFGVQLEVSARSGLSILFVRSPAKLRVTAVVRRTASYIGFDTAQS